MKKGLNLWSLMWPKGQGAPGWDSLVKIVKDMGYDGIEFTYDEAELNPQTMSKAQREKYADAARSQGLEIPSVATGVFWQRNLAGPDLKERERGIKLGRLGLELSSDVGAKVLLVVPAVNIAEVDYEQVWQRASESIRTLASYAEEVGVIVGIENVWNRFLYSPLEFRRFIESAQSDWVKAYLDLGNILGIGHPIQWIRELKGLVACVHVKDFDLSVGGLFGFRHLTKGSMDWDSAIRGLRSIGYDHYLNVECFPSFDPKVTSPTFQDALKACRENSSALDAILARA